MHTSRASDTPSPLGSVTTTSPSLTQARRVPGSAILVAVLALAGLWALDLFVLRTGVLTTFRKQPALTPLYAFWNPVLRAQALVFVVAAAIATLASARLADPDRTSRSAFTVVLLLLALALPLALFLVRQDLAELGSPFVIYPNEEFFQDAQRIAGVSGFLEHYVELMPRLSLHGQHFPPGHALVLYAVRLVAGEGTLPAGVTVLAFFAGGIVLAYLSLSRIASETAARQGALLMLACPSLLDFACTSMDAVFLFFAMLALGCALCAFAADGKAWQAIATGAALLLTTCFSFSALPLGLCVLVFALARARRGWRRALAQLARAGASYIALALLLRVATGFALWDCLQASRASGVALMAHITAGSSHATRLHLSYGNAAASLIGSGVALVVPAFARLRSGGLASDDFSLVALATLAIMAFGGIYSMETERIWLFAMPLLAMIAASRGPLDRGSLRALLAAGCAQALAMEILLFTLW